MRLAELEGNSSYNEKALEKLLIAELNGLEDVYNLACVYARLKQFEKARKKLATCKENNTLPSKEHLLNDPDLKLLRQGTWFNDFISDL